MGKGLQSFLLGGIFICIMGCSSTDIQSSDNGMFIQNIIGQNIDLAEPSSNKLWEGQIEGKQVSYFRSKNQNNFKNVVVVTQDDLPDNFRRVEYYDHDGDRYLDRIHIKMYHKGEGWNDVRITANNEHVLQHANVQYNELLNRIIDLRIEEVEF